MKSEVLWALGFLEKERTGTKSSCLIHTSTPGFLTARQHTPASVPLGHFPVPPPTHTHQLSISTGLQPHPSVTTTSGILLTPPERKIRFCSVAQLSSLHRRERSRSLGNEIWVFCILSGEVCKEPPSQATRKQAVLFLPLKYFQLQLHQAGRQDKGGHAESMCRSHMLHSEPRLFPLKTERVHSHISRSSIYILIN